MENSEFKPVKLHLNIDLVSYPVRAEGLVNMYIQLNDQTVIFPTIQFSINRLYAYILNVSFIWLIDRTRSGTTTQGQRGPGSDGNEGVLQRSSITGVSPSVCLMSYPGQSLGESYPFAETQSLYCTAPDDWAVSHT